MSSHLEAIPLDVLTQVAFFTIDGSPIATLDALLQLMLSSRTLHRLLSIRTCPQLYARIFRAQFDLKGHYRRSQQHAKTTSCLASELQERRRVLRRIRLGQIVAHHLLDDLWMVYLMLLESDALNETHLHAAGVGGWVLRVIQEHQARAGGEIDEQVLSLAISVACLVLSHNHISSLPTEDRNQVLNILRPFTTSSPKYLSTNVSGAVGRRILLSPHGSHDRVPSQLNFPHKNSYEVDKHPKHTSYFSRFTISAPNLLSGSVFLTFAFKEVTPLQVPPHLPPTRAAAIAAERHGPTMEDFVAITQRRTPLVADSFHQCHSRESVLDHAREQRRPSRSDVHDEDFYRIARHLDVPAETWEHQAYIPGLLTGVWEGSYMVAPSSTCPSPTGSPGAEVDQDFLCRQPIQFRLEENLSFTPWLPLPIEPQDAFDGHVLRNLCASEEESMKGIQFSDGNTAKTYHYEPFRLSGASESGRDPRHALDVVITGETPRRFEAAWGTYSFIGRIRLSDGLISLTRKPKSAGDDGCGTWVFEGYLRSRRTFVGKWGTLGAPGHEGIGGIFSMSKTAD
ncbi:hypothetical protein HYDPIDRAFT_28829 [Hydnomerulius pinastri MD-312]|uniref:F-box domain-containing protein n=1 Tax=Hydnomerulius pinastri MD-312 TaxID=994086 RepID=A0A0C9VSK6_9AGAM|nr:hypothetical protein HYDPIDRAFT_97668 [Hydnomerulius pinastri MD-312]KIJ64392.1 hypothetical protein HYDPIDRAFT_28829 [Hydnomerulius pinastri MD-312]